ncbi:uncharacterized protein ALTATR162_LOCUS10171 [Alternaria atra]|uniref:Uncharacterized protein n=1 Tax=Alternaria atra TaxID=119953 RepID=A0A8J2N9H0_9PLEO|nr:uncharacterized protein ALTATR162_LOCUS10171 [Alternaria atra]CAG5182457.1 unnamed protein product [Alternaria atra]
MDAVATPARISRVDSRFRHRAQIVPPHQERVPESEEKEEEEPNQESLILGPRGGDSMSRGHRFFHRRAALGNTKTVAVAVEVVATVDTNGSLVAQETLAPVTPQASNGPTAPAAPAIAAAPTGSAPSVVPAAQQPLPSAPLPGVPAVPTVALPVLPSVPAVPPFPSDLAVPTVPAYPYPTGIPVAQAAVSSDFASASPIPTGGPEGTATPSAAPDAAPLSAISFILNSTISSTASLLPSSSFASLDSISASTSAELIASIAAVPTRSASSSSSAPTSALQAVSSSSRAPSSQTSADSSVTRSTAIVSDAASTTAYYGGAGGDASGTAFAPAATTAAASDADASTSPSPLETPQVVGSVVGSLAGAALILAIILLLLRRHKRKQGGALQLTGDDHTDNNQSMRQAPTTSSTLVPVAFLNRFSAMSGKTAETNLSGGERSFQRVSGRKLPSAFSEGMTSDQFSQGGTMSGSSFYQDEHGIYGGPGISKEFGKEIGDSSMTRESGQMNIRPSPARTPVIRHPDDGNPFADRHYLSPPQSPNPDVPPRGTLGRSLPSADGSRSSRFTENV